MRALEPRAKVAEGQLLIDGAAAPWFEPGRQVLRVYVDIVLAPCWNDEDEGAVRNAIKYVLEHLG